MSAVANAKIPNLQINEEVRILLESKSELRDIEEKLKAASGIPKDGSGKPDYSDDFFGRNAFLAVSGQLNAEAYACALTDVYTFGEPLVSQELAAQPHALSHY